MRRSTCPQVGLTDESVSPQRIALFSLGNICVYELCRNSLFLSVPNMEQQLQLLITSTTDATCRKYTQRLLQKLGA